MVKWVSRTESLRDGNRGNCALLLLKWKLKIVSILYAAVTFCTGVWGVNQNKKQGAVSECGGVNGVLRLTRNDMKWGGGWTRDEKELRGWRSNKTPYSPPPTHTHPSQMRVSAHFPEHLSWTWSLEKLFGEGQMFKIGWQKLFQAAEPHSLQWCSCSLKLVWGQFTTASVFPTCRKEQRRLYITSSPNCLSINNWRAD